MTRLPLALIVALVACACSAADDAAPVLRSPPARLADTGLYADFDRGVIAPDVLPFAPQYPLWTDGAAKRRWIRLPEGAAIDASDADAWEFPVGTKLWKEFAWERPVETRYIERLADGSWMFASYAWTHDGKDAVLAPERGVRRAHEVAPGAFHDIPGRADCRVCHDAHGETRVLGVSALQLSPDRDPAALHADARPEGAADVASLAASGRLRGLAPEILARPPRIEAATPRERAALGYLHANCGTCHNPAGPLASLGLDLETRVAPGRRGSPSAGALACESRFHCAELGDGAYRVRPGASQRSVLLGRLSSRDPSVQMPPLGTRVVDRDAVSLVGAWIDQDLASLTPSAVQAGEAVNRHGTQRRER
jgi:hypothetical protein